MPTSPFTPTSALHPLGPLSATTSDNPPRPTKQQVLEDYNQRLLKSLEKKAHRLRSESNDGSGIFTPKLERIRESLSKTGERRGKSQ